MTRPRISPEISLGHILTFCGMAIGAIAMVFRIETATAVNTTRLDQHEAQLQEIKADSREFRDAVLTISNAIAAQPYRSIPRNLILRAIAGGNTFVGEIGRKRGIWKRSPRAKSGKS
ncbi:MAG: hypothetical protein AAFY31_05560 [Pseudomonadota bacterium]